MKRRHRHLSYQRCSLFAWTMILFWIGVVIFAVLLIRFVATKEAPMELFYVGGSLLLSGFYLLSEKIYLRCGTCMAPLFRALRCSRHKSAPRVCKSYRIGILLQFVLAPHRGTCPYCGTCVKSITAPHGPRVSEVAKLLQRNRNSSFGTARGERET